MIDKQIQAKDIEKIIKSAGGSILSDIEVFDVYTGTNIPENKKSIAYSLTFIDNKKTLTDDEINNLMNKIIENVCKKLGAKIRK